MRPSKRERLPTSALECEHRVQSFEKRTNRGRLLMLVFILVVSLMTKYTFPYPI